MKLQEHIHLDKTTSITHNTALKPEALLNEYLHPESLLKFKN